MPPPASAALRFVSSKTLSTFIFWLKSETLSRKEPAQAVSKFCALIFAFIVSFLSLNAQHAYSDSIQLDSISDSKLRSCIEKTLKKHAWTQVNEVQSLKCHNLGIKSLDGIEQFSHLKSLSLHKNSINTFNVQLPVLEQLNLGRNKLTQFKLNNVETLRDLYLFSNDLNSLELSNLPSLAKVKANSNKIIEFSYSALPKLEKVYLFDNEMEHIDIHSMPAMHYMDVRQNPMPDELYEEMDKMQARTILHDGNADDWD